MAKRVAIVQSNYIPWKGYFDLINQVDEFILLDDIQYTKRDWRNRNKIKTPHGVVWLSIPVEVKGKYLQLIKDTRISDPEWNQRHWRSIAQNYSGAKYFHEYKDFFQELYLGCDEIALSQINYRFLRAICAQLDIRTKLTWAMDYRPAKGRLERLISLCHQSGATEYLSGPSARSYLDEQVVDEAGIKVIWMDYADYPEYRQLYPPFEHAVSIIDLIMNEGSNAPRYMKSFGCNSQS